VSELRSVVEALRAEALAGLPDAQLEDDFAELQLACQRLEAERLRRLAEVERRAIHRRDGHLSCAAWLVRRFRLGWGAAREQVRLARALDHMPSARRALDEGEVSMSGVGVLARARAVDPQRFDEVEPLLAEAAVRHSVAELERVAAYWRQHVEADAAAGAGDDPVSARRSLHASVTLDGMVRVDGDLDPIAGETLLTALGAVLDAEARSRTSDDARSPAQRRADALGEICRQWLDRSDRPEVAGERPHLTLTVDVGDLTASTPGAELDRTGAIRARLAEMVTCDASVTRVVLSGGSQPLDVGRRTPVVPPAMRRAVIVRDRHCRFPGCDRPQAWCDAHHVEHWARGGTTSVANLLLLCRRHHRAVHESGGFTLGMMGRRPVFRRPDGSILDDRGPPRAPLAR
jgi:hypothetical protein